MADEDSWELPAAWRRYLHPRRGGAPCPTAAPAEAALKTAAEQLEGWPELLRMALEDPDSEPRALEAARAHRGGAPDPLGAATLAAGASAYDSDMAGVADAWAFRNGLVFAARAAVEMVALSVTEVWNMAAQRSDRRIVGHTVPVGEEVQLDVRTRAAVRVRALLAAVADDAEYAAVVEALAPMREISPRAAVAVAYLLPTEQAWVDEAIAAAGALAAGAGPLRTLLLCSVTTREQLAALGGGTTIGYAYRGLPLYTTLAEGLGAAAAPLVGKRLTEPYLDADQAQTALKVLVRLPGDEAFALVMSGLEGSLSKRFTAAAGEAAGRFPVRATRMLAEAAAKGSRPAEGLLAQHVRAHSEAASSALPQLPPEAAALVESLLALGVRIPEAAADAVPAVLTAPPWAKKRGRAAASAAPPVAEGLAAPEGVTEVWAAGEREEWAAADAWVMRSHWVPGSWEARARLFAATPEKLRETGAAASFLQGPEELFRPLVGGWDPQEHFLAPGMVRPVAARYGTAALPALLRIAAGRPNRFGEVLLPFADAATARLIASWAGRSTAAGRIAAAWLERHAAHAAPLLLPDAAGRPGPARKAAERMLRSLAEAHGPEPVRTAAAAYGPQAEAAIAPLLAADPLITALPDRMPKLPAWVDPVSLPQIRVRAGGALPDEAVRHLATMLAVSEPGRPYPAIAEVREACEPASLAAFGWALLESWRTAGMPAKESWTLAALGVLGDDDTARRLAPLIRAWPGESAHHRAVQGLDVLAAIGSDAALTQLQSIAERVKFRALKERAAQKISAVAEARGLSPEQLADRLVPDLGLDASGGLVLDYGPRRFTVGFDEQLRPVVRDEAGKARASLPAVAKKDDAELAEAARARFKALRADVRTLAGDGIRRLEAAMVSGRTWTAQEFRAHLMEHPLMAHLARRLVWQVDGAEVRVAEDRTLADVQDAPVALPPDAVVRLPHPLRLEEAGTLAAWSELFADYELLQPFPQLGRAVHRLTEQERGGHLLPRYDGVAVQTVRLIRLDRRGWVRGDPSDNGVARWTSKKLADHRYLVLEPDDGIPIGMPEAIPDQHVERIWLSPSPDDYWRSDAHPLKLGDIDPVAMSEALADLAAALD
ncbi:hypothetical protein BIV57_02405 [Mangrovactinospora gilvigrisea]|uniref:DUF4132 domain-containing protein n=1 Tax=Mangrovactinospora gilvigrisea TaxID=1428644 RepID=A0A1J7C041_9ACTN|nr:DUF4132 domain-containing protein [Mangrovactinospora gilvigrisea]OIV39097.1 hypothetical protein BIV57_02405 [Mangrovactinospora gilvigrisea]